MRKFFKCGTMCLLLSTLLIGGCSKPALTNEAKTYTIYKHKVSLTPPKDWAVREEDSPDIKGEKAAVVFTPPQGYGHIAVTITENLPQTQEFMNQLANAVSSRKGTIIKQWYEHKLDEPDKDNAYHMEFELTDGSVEHPKQKGMQVQIFTHNKVLYSLVFTADPEVYDANKKTFLAMVNSFSLVK